MLWHVPPAKRTEYWGSTEVLYFPYYAYEEILATIADPPRQSASLLASMERLTARLTEGRFTAMPTWKSGERERLKALYQPVEPLSDASFSVQPQPRRFFISYAVADNSLPIVRKLAALLDRRFGTRSTFWDERVALGQDWAGALDAAIREADVFLVFIGLGWRTSHSASESEAALRLGKPVVPLLLPDASWEHVNAALRARRGIKLGEKTLDEDLQGVVEQLAQSTGGTKAQVDIDDPQKGQWGGQSERGGRRLTARVSEGNRGWFKVHLAVENCGPVLLQGAVEFHLHPTFRPSMVKVPVRAGRAELEISSWGAFTVGAAADDGQTRLELNLADLTGAPEIFLAR